MMRSLKRLFEDYDERISLSKVPLIEDYTCLLCGNAFHYRPFLCAVYCNNCISELMKE